MWGLVVGIGGYYSSWSPFLLGDVADLGMAMLTVKTFDVDRGDQLNDSASDSFK